MPPPDFELTEEVVRAMTVLCTDHAVDRVKERFGLKKQAVVRFAKQAVANGKYFIYTRDKTINVTFTNNEKTFIFSVTHSANYNDPILLFITAHPTKHPIRKSIKEIKLKGEAVFLNISQSRVRKTADASAKRKNQKHKNSPKGHHDE